MPLAIHIEPAHTGTVAAHPRMGVAAELARTADTGFQRERPAWRLIERLSAAYRLLAKQTDP